MLPVFPGVNTAKSRLSLTNLKPSAKSTMEMIAKNTVTINPR